MKCKFDGTVEKLGKESGLYLVVVSKQGASRQIVMNYNSHQPWPLEMLDEADGNLVPEHLGGPPFGNHWFIGM